jgi:hypothetical protein
MRRTIMAAVATLSLAAPSAALAHHGERERHHHHHRGHHHHVHVLAFHSASAPSSTPAASDGAGTVASFSGGVLTIKLNDGSTVSGKVDDGTEIECPATTASAADFGRGHGDDGDDHDRFDDNGRDVPGDDRHGDCPGHDDKGGVANHQHCTTAALVPGASVDEAFLQVGSQGARWVKVEL